MDAQDYKLPLIWPRIWQVLEGGLRRGEIVVGGVLCDAMYEFLLSRCFEKRVIVLSLRYSRMAWIICTALNSESLVYTEAEISQSGYMKKLLNLSKKLISCQCIQVSFNTRLKHGMKRLRIKAVRLVQAICIISLCAYYFNVPSRVAHRHGRWRLVKINNWLND